MKNSLLWMGVCLLCVTCAYAAKLKVSGTIDAPGIDAAGMCDLNLGAQMLAKAIVNTTTGKFKVTGKATVQNQSNAAVKIQNAPDVLQCFEVPFFLSDGETVDRALYKVSKTGKARLSAKGTGQLP